MSALRLGLLPLFLAILIVPTASVVQADDKAPYQIALSVQKEGQSGIHGRTADAM